MSLTTIRDAVWGMLQVAAPTAGDNVLLLMALNNARLWAEREHDFALTKGVGYITVDADTGTPLTETLAEFLAGVPDGDAVDVKSIRFAKVWDTTNENWVDADHMSIEVYNGLIKRGNQLGPYVDNVTSLSLGVNPQNVFSTKNVLYLDGDQLYTHSDDDVQAQLWVFKWLPAYADFDADDDFLITRCQDFMLWEGVYQLNLLKGVFVPRNEGSLTPEYVIQMKQSAWDTIIKWDAFRHENNTYILSE